MHASPLYVANVNIPGSGFRNVVYAATEHDSVYAFDADGQSATPLWKASFINPAAGITTVPAGDTGECCDIAGRDRHHRNAGDRSGDAARCTSSPRPRRFRRHTNYVQRLHALDIATGAEKFGGPVVIQASVPGTGTGSSGGQIPFDAAAREPASGAAAEQRRRLHRVRQPRRSAAVPRLGARLQRDDAAAGDGATTRPPMAAAAASGRAAAASRPMRRATSTSSPATARSTRIPAASTTATASSSSVRAARCSTTSRRTTRRPSNAANFDLGSSGADAAAGSARRTSASRAQCRQERDHPPGRSRQHGALQLRTTTTRSSSRS